MQKQLLIILLTIVSYTAHSQSKLTSFYFYNSLHHTFGTSGGVYTIKTTLNRNSPIEIRPDQMAIIQTDADSLGLIMGDKVHYIQFERGMSYYYFISLPGGNSSFLVTKVTSQEFWFTVHSHKINDNQEYFLESKN